MKSKQGRWGLVLFLLVSLPAVDLRAQPQKDVAAPAGTEQRSVGPPPEIKRQVVESYGRLPLSFEANLGQTDPRVKFLSRGTGYTLFLSPGEAALAVRKLSIRQMRDRRVGDAAKLVNRLATETAERAVVRTKMVGANTNSEISGLQELPGKSNYFIGNDPKKWRTNVPNYAKLQFEDVYPGVDVVYHGNQRQLEYDFIVAPSADPKAIALAPEGAEKLEINAQGDLILYVSGEQIRLQKPTIYQEAQGKRQEIAGGYVLKSKREIGFQVAQYDASKPLVIDPVLSYATYLGGSGGDSANTVAVASDGLYVAGVTRSIDFPMLRSPFPMAGSDKRTPGQNDAFVAKFSSDGMTLLWSVYLGGSGSDEARAIAVDLAGNAYVAGVTRSADFPVLNPLQPGCSLNAARECSGDAFVAKLDPQGAIIYSTYLGDSDEDSANAIALDAFGNAYVAGATASTDFPVFAAFQGTTGGRGDAFVAKLAADGSRVLYATYLGGTGTDEARGIAVDAAGSVFVTGQTRSIDFPTRNPLQPMCALDAANQCSGDAFVAKLSPDGSALDYSTYLGGSGEDSANAIALDAFGNAYVAGATASTDFPLAKPLQGAAGGQGDAFVAKLDAAGTALAFATYLGGRGADQANSIAVDAQGNVHVAGQTRSGDFRTKGTIQPACARDASG